MAPASRPSATPVAHLRDQRRPATIERQIVDDRYLLPHGRQATSVVLHRLPADETVMTSGWRGAAVLPRGQLRVTLAIPESGCQALAARPIACDDQCMTTRQTFPTIVNTSATVALRPTPDAVANPRRRTAITVPDVILGYVQDELAARATGIWL